MTRADFGVDLERRAGEIEERRRTDRARRLEATPYRALLWLAVTPAWTVPLAEATGFPCNERGLQATIDTLRDEGLCEIATDPWQLSGAHGRFWMPRTARAQVLSDSLRGTSPPGIDVATVIGQIGLQIRQAQVAEADLPPLVRRWAELARESPDLQAISRALEQRIDACLRPQPAFPGDLATPAPRPEEALGWIDAARPLGEVLGDSVAAAVRQQGRRIDLVYRQQDDERHLAHFFLRTEPYAAFEQLINGSADRWALHFVGTGGVGKTMFLRYISGRWAVNRGGVTARIDFDHINPEFPTRAPALLLAHLMQELRLHANATVDRQFAAFESKMLALHERASMTQGEDAGDALRAADFETLVDVFADAVGMLPAPVVLLLDTCEELTKARLASTGLPDNVRATFQLLEMLHDRLASIRVVFCGRRPLASRGPGWELPGNSYPPRGYLALHELRGFSRAEGVSYLTDIAGVRQELVEPILAASIDEGSTMGFVRIAAPTTAPEVARYLPFSLSLYARWAREDPHLAEATISRGDLDPYVETRVVGRVRRPGLIELVPTMALVGRFDRDLLRAMSTRSDEEFEEALRDLREQDWVLQQDGDFFEVKPHLRGRLLAYLERSGRTVVAGTAVRAVAYLTRLTEQAPFSRLAIAHFGAAVLLLAAEPAQAFDWWERIERRFAEAGEFDWARRLVEWLLSDEGPAAERSAPGNQPEHPLRPAILATYAAVLARTGETSRLDLIWCDVEAMHTQDPRPEGARRLAWRARAGRVAALRETGSAMSLPIVEAFVASVEQALVDRLDEQAAAQGLAAFETLVEMDEVRSAPAIAAWRPSLAHFAEALSRADLAPELTAFASALVARSALLRGSAPETKAWWDTSFTAARSLVGPTRQRWLAWRAPDELQARLQLEFGRAAHPALYDAEQVLKAVKDEIGPPTSIDSDRLGTVVLQLRGVEHPPFARDAGEWAYETLNSSGALERCNAHRILPPLSTAYWEVEALAYGRVDDAMEALRSTSAHLQQTTVALPTVGAVERARLRIARRMRLRDEERVSDSIEQGGGDVDYTAALQALAAFDARSRPETRLPSRWPPPRVSMLGDPAPWLHLYWRSIPTVFESDVKFAVQWAASMPFDEAMAGDSYASMACQVDALEANRLAEKYHLALPYLNLGDAASALRRVAAAVGRWMEAHPLEPEAHLRLSLRIDSLGRSKPRRKSATWKAAGACGHRFAATVALEEGELLSLRLPDAAAPVLRYAEEWFQSAGDPVGGLIAAGCRALAAARISARSEIKDALLGARHAYGELLAGVSEKRGRQIGLRTVAGLPQWKQLDEIAKRPESSALDRLSPDGWRPWLVRFVAALAWVRDGHRHGERSTDIGLWLESTYGAIRSDGPRGVVLPPELAPWTPPPRRSVAVDPVSAELHPARAGGSSSIHVLIRSREERERSPRPITPVSLSVRFPPTDESRMTDEVEEVVGVLLGTERYLNAARLGFPGAASMLAGRFEQAGPPELIELVVDLSVASGCWEGLLSILLAGERPENEAPEGPRFVRRSPAMRGLPVPPAWRQVSVVLSRTGDFSLGRLMRQAWAIVEKNPGSTLHIELAQRTTSAAENPQVVHLLGSPIETGFGKVALQLGPSSGGGQTITYKDSVAERGGEVLYVSDLPRMFGRPVLFVLQAPPIAGRDRNRADQECAGFLRMMAAELSAIGVPGVLTIPPLPLRDAMDCLQHVAHAVIRREVSMQQALLEAVQEARRVVRGGSLDDIEDRSDAAADFCLYLVPNAAQQ